MTRDDLLAIWRANLDNIERRIAEYGGETRAPLELVSLLREARREIAALESDFSEDARRSPSEQRLRSLPDYALVEVERLRRDLAAWQADVGRDLIEMAEQHIKPSEQMIYSLNNKLDVLGENMQQVQVRLAVLEREVKSLCDEFVQIRQSIRDVEKRERMGVVDIGSIRGRWLMLWMLALGVLLIIMQMILMMKMR